MPSNNLSQQSYVSSGVWRCEESPSGAHHWVEKTGPATIYGTFRCLHCCKENAPPAVNLLAPFRRPS
jgi:hypothetical protein